MRQEGVVPVGIAFTSVQRSALCLWDRRLAFHGHHIVIVRDHEWAEQSCEESVEVRPLGEEIALAGIHRTPRGQFVAMDRMGNHWAIFDHLSQAIRSIERGLGFEMEDWGSETAARLGMP